ncbi:MAG TPA: helix-turn-helix domain-containing protein, partial [Anaerolineae bacterium]|nr:helix-turn-helix domain-containing protein [Anaerolineae bacterium]
MTGCIMNELLTTKQVQDYLKVDRTTIYRMLKDGRLNGIKVGKQWRFPRSEIEGLSSVPVAYSSVATSHDNALPLECVQTVQDVTADTMEVGAVVTDEDGFPLTAVSNSSRFCQLILGTESGRQACMASWRRLFRQGGDAAQMLTCHAGCQFARAPIVINGRTTTQF